MTRSAILDDALVEDQATSIADHATALFNKAGRVFDLTCDPRLSAEDLRALVRQHDELRHEHAVVSAMFQRAYFGIRNQ